MKKCTSQDQSQTVLGPYGHKTELLNLFSRHSHVGGGGKSSLEQSFGVSTDAAATASAPLRALAAAACPGPGAGLASVSRVGLARIRSLVVFTISLHACLCCLNVLVELRCVLLRC